MDMLVIISLPNECLLRLWFVVVVNLASRFSFVKLTVTFHADKRSSGTQAQDSTS